MDRAGWHATNMLTIPNNITPILLPSYSRELNQVENIWQSMRANWLSDSVFETYDDIIDAACEAWNKLIATPDQIKSIGIRDWVHVGRGGEPLVLFDGC
jgi:transposase